MMFPKPIREQDAAYLDWIRSKSCLVGVGCWGDVVPHHLETRGAGGSDYAALPVCVHHHAQIHALGERTSGDKYVVDWWKEAWKLLKEWHLSPPGGQE
jgi:hypothetical protein